MISRHPLLIPIAAALLVAVVGWWSNSRIEQSLKTSIESDLRTVLAANVEALDVWLHSHQTFAKAVADRAVVRRTAQALLDVAGQSDDDGPALSSAPAQGELRGFLQEHCDTHAYPGFGLISPSARVIGASSDPFLGYLLVPELHLVIGNILADGAGIVRPHVRKVSAELQEKYGSERTNVMFVAAPVKDDGGRPIAVLGFEMKPAGDFSQILAVGQMEGTGETYAFDANGLLLSHSRFENQLRQCGLLPDDPKKRAILNVEIRNPGGDLTQGYKTDTPLKARALTKMAARAVAMGLEAADNPTGSGARMEVQADVDGYRDYRGVEVVGAWTWLPRYGFGVATELDYDEAYLTLRQTRTAFRVLFGVMLAFVVGFFLYSRWTSRLQSSVEHAMQLGQYSLEEKLGEGGMGKVYRAHHAMMRRPVAIKLMTNETGRTGKDRAARFEREVVLTSQLTHPNTIAIYDYGCTPEGTFYYAMECLDGVDLSELVVIEENIPEGRVIHIVRQILASLKEAHSVGFIHRDIKPANVILCERGGIHDMVKVLDFGLVKQIESDGQAGVTAPGMVTGTPDYLAPEVLRDAERAGPSADLYAVGALTYYLLCGRVLFEDKSVFDVCQAHMHQVPTPPSERRGEPISTDLEDLVMRSLAKNPETRPASAAEFIEELDACHAAGSWGDNEARQWWEAHQADINKLHTLHRQAPTGAGSGSGTGDMTLRIDHEGR